MLIQEGSTEPDISIIWVDSSTRCSRPPPPSHFLPFLLIRPRYSLYPSLSLLLCVPYLGITRSEWLPLYYTHDGALCMART